STSPVLFSDADSTRAIAVDSVTSKHEPFQALAAISFSTDTSTRVTLFAGRLKLAPGEGPSAVIADAEDESHNVHSLTVENVGPVPDQPWATAVTVRLNEDMGNLGDVLMRISYHGAASNRVRVGIGHVGDGPPDDPGAVPTPGPLGIDSPINPIT